MKIRFWGARGSIPVSGPEYIRYGGDTTCVEIRGAGGEILIVDAGSGIRRLGNALAREEYDRLNLLFTHVHWDHILGFPFFRPLYFSNTRIDVYGCSFADSTLRTIFTDTMAPPYFPVKYDEILAEMRIEQVCDRAFDIGGIRVETVFLSHPNHGQGFRFTEGGRSFVFLTDNELGYSHPGAASFDDYARFCRGADLLVHDAEFTEADYRTKRTWGHSTWNDALRLALASGVRSLGLFHHNQERTDEGVDRIVGDAVSAARGAGSGMAVFAVSGETEVTVA